MVYAAVLAGGIGSRMGANLPKQYLKIGGAVATSATTTSAIGTVNPATETTEPAAGAAPTVDTGIPIIALSVRKFVTHPEVIHTVVLTPDDWVTYTQDLLAEYIPDTSKFTVIAGGETRNDTLYNSLRFFEEHYDVSDEDVILTHDAVRPFVTARIIDDNIRLAKQYGGCNTVIPATDTIMESKGGEVIESIPNRSDLYQVQTPQSFNLRKLEGLMDSLTAEEAAILTDGSKIFLMRGEPCYLVPGEVFNIKITYPTDMAIANAFYAELEQ